MRRVLMILLGIGVTMQSQAFPCFLTLVKDNCWTNYDVTVTVTNASAAKTVVTITAGKGKAWERQKFDCQPAEALSLQAVFTPVFWEADLGKVYPARHDWLLPEAVSKGDTAWNIPVCYPADFSEVPMPPNISGNCICNMKDIPAVKPQ